MSSNGYILTRASIEDSDQSAHSRSMGSIGPKLSSGGKLRLIRPCAGPEGGGGSGSERPTPLKNHKNIGFSSNTGLDPLTNRSYQASIQCWAIIDIPAKRHGGPMKARFNLFSLHSPTKKKKKRKTLSKLDSL